MQFINLVKSLFARIPTLTTVEDGQTLVEYGLILALISIGAILIMGTVGANLVEVFTAVADDLHS